ncbi:MAG: hypothetical protein IKW80_10370 [Thermoguttaceae bacterium]|nr:hypothetical protein [Thermoguttaceae bacterium]
MRLPKDPQSKPKKNKDAALLGVGFDNQDEETRLTKGENYLLVGGSKQTHEIMQETAVKVNEQLEKKGKRLADLEPDEFRDVIAEAVEKTGRG